MRTSAMANARERIEKVISENPVVLFMKGTPEFPQCGFSGQVIQILDYRRRAGCRRERARGRGDSPGDQGIRQLADGSPALRQRRVRGRMRHHARDVPVGRIDGRALTDAGVSAEEPRPGSDEGPGRRRQPLSSVVEACIRWTLKVDAIATRRPQRVARVYAGVEQEAGRIRRARQRHAGSHYAS